uniref:uncharacterized protein isoform X2 n=1 Tax=Myxine glutinosa TaxID=7769 RepID=UPI00358EE34C
MYFRMPDMRGHCCALFGLEFTWSLLLDERMPKRKKCKRGQNLRKVRITEIAGVNTLSNGGDVPPIGASLARQKPAKRIVGGMASGLVLDPRKDFSAWLLTQGVSSRVAQVVKRELGIGDYEALLACAQSAEVRSELFMLARERLSFAAYAVLRRAIEGLVPRHQDSVEAPHGIDSPSLQPFLGSLLDSMVVLLTTVSKELSLSAKRLSSLEPVIYGQTAVEAEFTTQGYAFSELEAMIGTGPESETRNVHIQECSSNQVLNADFVKTEPLSSEAMIGTGSESETRNVHIQECSSNQVLNADFVKTEPLSSEAMIGTGSESETHIQECSSNQVLNADFVKTEPLSSAKYGRTLEKLKISEDTSDLNTEEEEIVLKRRRIGNKKFINSDSNSDLESDNHVKEEDVPPPPESLLSGCPVAQPAPQSLLNTRPRASNAPVTPQIPFQATLVSVPPMSLKRTSASSSTRYLTPWPDLESISVASNFPTTETFAGGERRYRVGEKVMTKVLSLLGEVKEALKVHSSMLQSLVRMSRTTQEEAIMPEGLDFPLQSLADFEVMEGKLSDPAIQNGLVHVLGDLGGRTLDECTRRTMQFVISTGLSMKINLHGRNGKKAFGPSHLFEVVCRSIKKNTQTSDCNKKEIETAVAKWLIGGRDRGGNRARRVEEACSKQANRPPDLPIA